MRLVLLLNQHIANLPLFQGTQLHGHEILRPQLGDQEKANKAMGMPRFSLLGLSAARGGKHDSGGGSSAGEPG